MQQSRTALDCLPVRTAGRPGWETTTELLARAQAGDPTAADHLFAHYRPVLTRWARGRLPRFARNMEDTEDLVQDTLYRAALQLPRFEPRHPGSMQAYLKQALLNRIKDLVRRATRRPAVEDVGVDVELEDGCAPSPLEQAIGGEALTRYERALARLSSDERALIVARVELTLSFAEIAAATGRPSADAARMAAARALLRLAREMGRR